MSVDDAARIVSDLGRGLLLAKVDMAHAYCNVAIHPADRYLLGMKWDNQLYIDTTLPFGLRSTPKIFCAISNTLEWVPVQRGISTCLNYIDDFLTMGPPQTATCQKNLDLIVSTCSELGLPLVAEKVEGPTPTLTFQGVELDTTQMVVLTC